MKKIFPSGRTTEFMRIKTKIEKMEKIGLFFIEKEKGINCYSLIKDNVRVRKFRFPNKTSKGVCIKVYGRWQVFEL